MSSAIPLESSRVAADGTLILDFMCPGCGQVNVVSGIDQKRYMTWRSGQGSGVGGAFPELSAAEREALMTGYHDRCFDDLFAEEDE
jgi:hypothetical protein